MYLRVSLDATGEGLAVERQRQDCRRIAAERGWRIVEEYVDNSISASDRDKRRPAYDRMVSDFAAGRFQALVCWDLDRLTRQPRQLEDWIDAAEGSGLLLVTANGEADLTTDGGRLFARIKASVARAEVERKSARQKRAARQRAEHGRPPKGVRLTGYTLDGDPIPAEQRIVRRIFRDFQRGESLRGIAAALEAEGIPTRSGRTWNPSSVRTILTNPRYAGLSTYCGQPIGTAGTWRGIVTQDAFELVQAKLADPRRATNRQGTDRKHLGSGLFECGHCRVKLTAWSGARYRCHKCGMTRVMPAVDEAVELVVHELLRDPRLPRLMAPSDSGKLDKLQAKAATLRDRLDRIGQDYDAGIIDGLRFRSASDKVRAELEDVMRAQVEITGSSAASELLTRPNPVRAFDGETLMVRRAVVDSLVRVQLYRAPQGRKSWDPSKLKITPRWA